MTLSARETTLCRAIEARADALVEDLRRLVALPTGGGHAPGLDETRSLLTARLEKLGARAELVPGDPAPEWLHGGPRSGDIPPTAVSRRPRPAIAGAHVLISGHLDTVHDPSSGFRSLTVDASRGRATGPGCIDMKGGLVIAMAALEALDEVGIDASWSVILNSDEETGSYHSERALRAEAARADVGIALEPALADGALAIERAGSGQFVIECHGRSAHVGRDFTAGVSAVTALARALLEVDAMCDARRGLVASVGPIEGGRVTNAVPDRARAWGNVRFRDLAGAEELGRRLDALATPRDAMPRTSVLRSFNRPFKPRTAETESLALAARGAALDLGGTLEFASTGGVCDGNTLQDAGLPTIDTLGVRGGGMHTPDEWIELPSLVGRCKLLAVLIARLAHAAPGGIRPRRTP